MRQFIAKLTGLFGSSDKGPKQPPFLSGWSGKSLEEILEMKGEYRVDSLVLALEEAVQYKESKGKRLTEAETSLLAIEALEREVNNGGFMQFFGNRTSEYVVRIEQDLIAIGCPNTAAIVLGAINALAIADRTPSSIASRLDADDSDLASKLEELDEAFLAYPDDIEGQLFNYVASNRDKFESLVPDGNR